MYNYNFFLIDRKKNVNKDYFSWVQVTIVNFDHPWKTASLQKNIVSIPLFPHLFETRLCIYSIQMGYVYVFFFHHLFKGRNYRN